MTLTQLRHCVFGYGSRPVIHADGLQLQPARCLGIFGPNGAGKTTLVRGITGLLPPLAGAVTQTAEASIRFAYMPHLRAMELHWPMSGLDAAAMMTSARTPLGWIRTREQQILSMMRTLGVEDLARRSFARLSGGQQQRILLAGAMASEPSVLVLDEPTDGLDVHSRDNLLALLRDFATRGLCTVLISHDLEDLLFLADEVAWVHPANEPNLPSQVEIVPPDAFAQRVTQRRTSRGAA
jgi:ABC-type Mn2+/Zn2+ transport system ATPase subunit